MHVHADIQTSQLFKYLFTAVIDNVRQNSHHIQMPARISLQALVWQNKARYILQLFVIYLNNLPASGYKSIQLVHL
ncbi:hypothetical protein D3C73_1271580 [compost metagenome]